MVGKVVLVLENCFPFLLLSLLSSAPLRLVMSRFSHPLGSWLLSDWNVEEEREEQHDWFTCQAPSPRSCVRALSSAPLCDHSFLDSSTHSLTSLFSTCHALLSQPLLSPASLGCGQEGKTGFPRFLRLADESVACSALGKNKFLLIKAELCW